MSWVPWLGGSSGSFLLNLAFIGLAAFMEGGTFCMLNPVYKIPEVIADILASCLPFPMMSIAQKTGSVHNVVRTLFMCASALYSLHCGVGIYDTWLVFVFVCFVHVAVRMAFIFKKGNLKLFSWVDFFAMLYCLISLMIIDKIPQEFRYFTLFFASGVIWIFWQDDQKMVPLVALEVDEDGNAEIHDGRAGSTVQRNEKSLVLVTTGMNYEAFGGERQNGTIFAFSCVIILGKNTSVVQKVVFSLLMFWLVEYMIKFCRQTAEGEDMNTSRKLQNAQSWTFRWSAGVVLSALYALVQTYDGHDIAMMVAGHTVEASATCTRPPELLEYGHYILGLLRYIAGLYPQ